MPTKKDGKEVFELIKEMGVLDLNSSYSYLLWCEVFSQTSIVAKDNGKIVGFISGFINPEKRDHIFIWQVAVNSSERGQGLATRMLFELIDRKVCEDVHYVEATISPSNTPSRNLFKGLAKKLDTKCIITDYFKEKDFPSGENAEHEDEDLFRIGPFNNGK